jgi:hypothetical protein
MRVLLAALVLAFIPPLVKKAEALDPAAAVSLIVIVFGVIAIVSGRWMGTYNKGKTDD